jgi:membrane protease YdiL (CAAX protease family)
MGIAGAALAAFLNGVVEETEWRGFLLPSLQPRYGAKRAAFIVGACGAVAPSVLLLAGELSRNRALRNRRRRHRHPRWLGRRDYVAWVGGQTQAGLEDALNSWFGSPAMP